MTSNFLVNNNETEHVSKIKSRILLINHRKIYAGDEHFLSG